MSIKIKAFIQAVAIFVLCIVAGITVSFAISKIPVEAIPWICVSALAGLAINLLYGTVLNQLEAKERLKELSELNSELNKKA